MKDKYILDSSIWIELERQSVKVVKEVRPLIQKNQVCLIDVIVAEVLRGCRIQKDFDLLLGEFRNFRWLKTQWETVAELGFRLSHKGYHPPLIDLYIALCTMENKRVLVTQDKHFSHIAKVLPLKIVMLENER